MSSVCRICLIGNTRLHTVQNNLLHSCYEKLTNAKFHSEDARPRALCCFCYQKLLRCHTFSQMAVRSEKIFENLYDRGLEVTHEYLTEVNVKHCLSVATTSFVTIDDNATNAGSQRTIKDEPVPSIDMIEKVISEPDKLLKNQSSPEYSMKSQITFEEDNSDGENDTEELLSYSVTDQTKSDDSSSTINDEPLTGIDIQEEVTTEPDESVEVEECTKSQLIDKGDQGSDVRKLLFNIHAEQTEPDDSKMPFSCNNCNKIFVTKSQIISHIRNSHPQLIGKQYSCTKEHTETTSMIEDRTIQKEKFACHVCDKQFNQKVHLVSHMRTHTGEVSFACNVCEKQCKRKYTLVLHMRTHTGDKPFACHVCDKQFNQKVHLVLHMKTHSGERPFICHVCDKQFNTDFHYVSHMRTHTGEKPFACNMCDKQFYKKSIFVSHMRTHTDEKPFSCNVCDKPFNRKYNLVCHMRIHTGEKPFACNLCDKHFNRKFILVSHMTKHTGGKLFACNVCEKQFNRKIDLIEHLRLHTGENLVACNVCDKKFTQRKKLISHIRTHTGEKPFACNICDKQFVRKYNLVSHMRIHKSQKHPKPARSRGGKRLPSNRR